MDEVTLIMILVVSIVALFVGRRWWKNRRSAKLADELLAIIVKEKDSFRR